MRQQMDVFKIVNELGLEMEHRTFLKELLGHRERETDIGNVLKMDWFRFNLAPDKLHPKSPFAAAATSPDAKARARTFNVLGGEVGNIYKEMAEKGYVLTYLIGKGGYGSVYGGNKVDSTTGQVTPVAMKVIGGFNQKWVWIYRLKRYPIELKIMRKLRHPNLVHVYDVFLETNNHGRNWDRRCFIFMERSKTDLLHYSNNRPGNRTPEVQLAPLIAYALNGLEFLHENRIAHRDIKPGNILIHDTPQGEVAKLTDYSLIREADYNCIAETLAATSGYRSPACITRRYNPFKLDVFSMGIVIFECLLGRHPNWEPEGIRDANTLLGEFQRLQDDIQQTFAGHEGLLVLLRDKMLTLQDGKRATVTQVRMDPWFPNVWTHPMYQEKDAFQGFKDPKVSDQPL